MPYKKQFRPNRASSSCGHRPQQNRGRNSNRQPKKDYINPSRFVQTATMHTAEVYMPEHSFADFDLHEILDANLQNMGFTDPSPIQDQSIMQGMAGKDIVGIADTGTGKTAAFALPTIHRLITESETKAIILAPTRELAEQIEQQCRKLGKNSGLNSALLIGGGSMGGQLSDLRQDPRVVIGTPGRIKDHLKRGSLNLSGFNITVLDEVDRMLDMGFVHDITEILSRTNPTRQSFYFSATLDSRVKDIINQFSKDPIHISVKSGNTSDNVNQDIVRYDTSDKIEKLHDILIEDGTIKTIIFEDTQRDTERLAKELIGRGFSADSIHGGKSQSQRRTVLKKFKASEVSILVATDVAARGLDVPDISHVVNYALPQTYADYVHRIGRTGRAGKVGTALTFVKR